MNGLLKIEIIHILFQWIISLNLLSSAELSRSILGLRFLDVWPFLLSFLQNQEASEGKAKDGGSWRRKYVPQSSGTSWDRLWVVEKRWLITWKVELWCWEKLPRKCLVCPLDRGKRRKRVIQRTEVMWDSQSRREYWEARCRTKSEGAEGNGKSYMWGCALRKEKNSWHERLC